MGVLKNDLYYAHANTPGVCIVRQMSLPVVPPPAEQEGRVRYARKSIRRCQREDARARKAFEVQKSRLAMAGEEGTEGLSNEVLPRHQRLTAGKPALCRPIAQTREAMAKTFMAEDSYFVSEYRHNMWWKNVMEGQKREIKEHVRPYDNWTLFRETAVRQNPNMRFPI